MKFDGILDGIPSGANVISATLSVFTSEEPFAGSGGPFGVSQLLVPFDASTTYETAVSGFTFMAGEAKRPLANGFVGLDPGFPAETDVTEIVQAWVDGEENYGFLISAGTTNGWNIFTSSGLFDPSLGPALTIVYDDTMPGSTPTTTVEIVQSAGDASTSMFVVDVVTDTFSDGDTLDSGGAFLDGDPDGDPDLQALLRFDSIFAADGGPVADDAVIVDAKLILTTSSCEFSTNSATDDPFGVRQVLTDYDGTGSFADLTFGEVIDLEFGLIQDSQACYDVTSVIQDFQNGADNFGFNVLITASTNGWAIIPSSATAFAPTLQITFEGKDILLGDVNGDGVVDLLDVAPFVDAITNGDLIPAADINQDGIVDLLDVAPFVAILVG